MHLADLDKSALLRAVDAQISEEIAAATARARATAASVTHEESRAENDKDTRAIEESYLARGQAQRVADLEHERGLLRTVQFRELDAVAVGALVLLDDGEEPRIVLLVPAGGGRKVDIDGSTIQLVTPQAPLGAALLGKEEGDEVTLTIRRTERAFEVAEIR